MIPNSSTLAFETTARGTNRRVLLAGDCIIPSGEPALRLGPDLEERIRSADLSVVNLIGSDPARLLITVYPTDYEDGGAVSVRPADVSRGFELGPFEDRKPMTSLVAVLIGCENELAPP